MTRHAVVRSPVTHGRLESLGGAPWWYHHHGAKMNCIPTSTNALACIRNNTARVKIHSANGIQKTWNVTWDIAFSREEVVSGNRIFTAEQLECAFGLKDNFTYEADIRNSNLILQEFGGTVAYQGRFIRWQNYLNIPGPGTGHDGSTAVSMYLDDSIRKAVRTIIQSRT